MPAHVPVSFLLVGGAGVFDQACRDALVACNYNPNWIGSYEHVNARIRAAAKARDEWLAGKGDITMEELWLCNCTTGHIQRDVFHRDGGASGDNCRTTVDGYTYAGALAIASYGQSGNAGTVECELSMEEGKQTVERRKTAVPEASADGLRRDYPLKARTDDEDVRIAIALATHDGTFPDGTASKALAGPEKASEVAAIKARSAPKIGGATPDPPVPDTKDGEHTISPIKAGQDTDTPQQRAAACIQAYRDALNTPEAKIAAVDKEIERQDTKRPQYEAQLAKAKEDVERWTNAPGRPPARGQPAIPDGLKPAEQRLTAAQEALDDYLRNPPQGLTAKQAARRTSELEGAVRSAGGAVKNAEKNLAAAQARVEKAERMNPDTQIGCLKRQRARIAAHPSRAYTTGTLPA